MPVEIARLREGDWEQAQSHLQRLARQANPVVPQARVYNSAAISITTSGTGQILTFDNEDYDSADLHSTSSNTSRLTASITGLWSVGCAVSFASNATGYREVQLLVNGTTFIADDTRMAVNGAATSVVVETEYHLNAGDYVEVRVVQTSGGALNVNRTSRLSPEFWMHRTAGFVNQGV